MLLDFLQNSNPQCAVKQVPCAASCSACSLWFFLLVIPKGPNPGLYAWPLYPGQWADWSKEEEFLWSCGVTVELLPRSWLETSGGCSFPGSSCCLSERDLIPVSPCSTTTSVLLQCSLLPLQSSGLSLALNYLRMNDRHSQKTHYTLPFLKAKTHARRA